jgi:hypothetical protein
MYRMPAGVLIGFGGFDSLCWGGGWGLDSDVLVGLICGVLGNSRSWRIGVCLIDDGC